MARFRFSASVEPASLPDFTAFFEAVLSGKPCQKCDITLMAIHQRPPLQVRIEASVDERGKECRMVVMSLSGVGLA